MSEQRIAQAHLTIVDNNDIESIVVEYARNQSTTNAPTSGWSTTRPAWAQGYYIWQRTRTHKSGTSTDQDSLGNAVCITGSTGQTGATGQSLSSTKTQYTNVASNVTITTSNHTNYTWTDNVPAYDGSKPVYWCRVTNTYINPSKTEYIVYKDQGTTDAIKTSNDANTTANSANTKADSAVSTANSANQTANQTQTNLNNYMSSNDAALSALQTKTKYFWTNLVAHTNGSGGWTKPNYPVGTYAASGISGTTFDEENSSTYGYNTLYANGIKLRYNAINLGELTGSSLIFYKPSTTSQGGKAMELSGSALKFYNPTNDSISMMDLTSSGLTFKTAAGATIGTFGSDASGGLLDLSGRLNIKGGGRIGQDSDNYWEFGDNKSYNDEDSAYLMGKGTASIQLGETGHWRLDRNRIHTGWYQLSDSTAGTIHFDTGADNGTTYYWDYGLHYPNKSGNGNNKFLYIRRSSSSTSTSLATMKSRIDDDSWWVYKFYVDGDGNIHAKNFFVGDSDTPIGGGTGTIAEKIINSDSTYGKGSVTQPIYIDSNGRPATTTYTLNAAGAKGVDTNFNNTSSTNLPTTAAVVTYVTGRGYKTTDENVQTSQANDKKIYLVGTQTIGTTTGKLNFDSNIYADTTTGALHATTFNGYTLAAASAKGVDTSLTATSTSTNLPTSKAVADLIKQYLPLTGGQVTGPVNFGDSVSVDDLTAGNLIINGAGRFTNGLYGDLTGNADTATTATKVGKDLKIQLNGGTTEGTNQFTFNGSAAKTVNITKSSIGLGNVENKSSATIRGELTSANVTTALGFTPYNSTNPNGYTTNTGTVTSVAASGSGGITISGSPITTSGTITVGLNLSTAINGLGEGTSAAQRDDYIVAQYAGGGTTTTTYHRRKLSNIFAALNSSDITTALGYTPYDATNPNGYTTNTGTVTSVKVQGSNGLTGSGTVTTTGTITLSHADTSSQASSSNSGRTYIQSVTLDGYGHVTGLTTATETVTDTHHTANLITGASATAKANAAATNGNVYLNLVENNTVRNAHKIVGSGTTTVTSDADGIITISSADSKTGTVTSITLTQGTGISIGSSGTAITTSGTRTIALADNYGDTKNPYASKTARYVLAAPANAAGAPSFRALTGADVGLGSVLNATQVTGIGQGADGKIRVYKGDSNYEDVAVEIVATESSSVASAQKLTSYGGSTKQPVYFPNSGTNAGKPVAIGYTIETSVPSGAVFTDTTYTFASGTNGFTVTPLNGTAQTVTVTPSIANNITGSGTSGYLAKFNGTNTITNGPALGTDATKFLNNKGEWATPSGAVTGVKGNSESTYRTGQVNITKANIGLGNVDNTADANKNVLTATKFSSSRTIALTGDVTGSASGDGSSGWSVATTVQDDSHNHTVDTIKPKLTKTYTGIIATANNQGDGNFYFIKVVPEAYGKKWFIQYRVYAEIAGVSDANGNGKEFSDVYIAGARDNYISYRTWNDIAHTSYRPYYYHAMYRARESVISQGHGLGLALRSSYNQTTVANSRTVTFEIVDYDGCTVSFLDTPVKYTGWPSYSSSNYLGINEFDATTQGNTMSGDRNDPNYQHKEYYASRTAHSFIGRYTMVLSRDDGTIIPTVTVDNNITTTKTYNTTDEFDPFGGIFYFYGSGTTAAGGNVPNNYLFDQVMMDLRYGFNVGGYNTTSLVTARKPFYLVATPQSNGMAKIHSSGFTQTLPTSDDGLIYIYLGTIYEDTYPYRLNLALHHPVYWYKDGAVRQYTHMAARALADESGNTISSTYVKKAGDVMTGNLGIQMGDTDKHIIFDYDGDGSAGASWRIAALGTGSSDTNYFAIQSGTSTTTATTWNNVIRLGQNTYDAAFGGNVYPLTSNSKTLGTSSLKWSNVYATTFTGNLTGNVTGNVTGTASGNVTSVQYDSTNAKFTYTKNGTNTDIATIANLKTYLGLGAAAYKGVTDNSTATAVTSTDTNLITARTLYNAGYTKNVGTITGVTAGTGLSGGGTSGAVTLNHSNSVTAKTAAAQSAKTLTWGGTFTLYEEKYDAQGHITGVASYNMTMPSNPNTDTKNTAGSTNTSSEIYLIGATSQAANPQTYSHDTARVRANGNFVGTGYEMATSSAMGSSKATMAYDSTLEAIVFSFS